jgi:hypothetical protein
MALKLRREVEPPQRQNTGLGVMLVASAAMFFAVAGSAFILRARMASSCCVRAHTAASATVVVEAPGVPAAEAPSHASLQSADCGQAVYRNNPDGSVSVYFDLCPPVEPALGDPDDVHVVRIVSE